MIYPWIDWYLGERSFYLFTFFPPPLLRPIDSLWNKLIRISKLLMLLIYIIFHRQLYCTLKYLLLLFNVIEKQHLLTCLQWLLLFCLFRSYVDTDLIVIWFWSFYGTVHYLMICYSTESLCLLCLHFKTMIGSLIFKFMIITY